MPYVVYLIPYARGGTEQMYCGHTNDPERRWIEHCKRGFLGTKVKRSMRVISTHTTKSLAYREELRVKALTSSEKQRLYDGSSD